MKWHSLFLVWVAFLLVLFAIVGELLLRQAPNWATVAGGAVLALSGQDLWRYYRARHRFLKAYRDHPEPPRELL